MATSALVVGVLLMAGCGAGRATDRSTLAARIGRVTITVASVGHWARVLAGGRAAALSSPERSRGMRKQAIAMLIAWQWTVGEAAEYGVAPTQSEVAHELAARERREYPGGDAELEGFLKASGETRADLALEVEAMSASRRLKALVTARVPAVTAAQVAAYYRRRSRQFAVDEQRELRIANAKSFAKGAAIRREIEAGRIPVSELATERRPLPPSPEQGSRPHLEAAIRKAGLGVLEGPVKQRIGGSVYDYFVFWVTRIIPANHRPLADVGSALAARLAVEARHRALASFIARWRRKWLASTNCTPEYVVQKCRQYAGPRVPEPALAFR